MPNMAEIQEQMVQRIEAASREIDANVTRLLQAAVKTCIVCDHFNKGKETCLLNNLRPPAEIIAFGCECFENEIPF